MVIGIVLAACLAAGPEFEVASFKLLPSGKVREHFSTSQSGNDRVSYRNAPLRILVSLAYGISDSRLLGLPNWADNELYDLVANLPKGSTQSEVPEMVQTLLKQRLRLEVQKEQRVESVFYLTVDRDGPKLKQAKPGVTGPNYLLPGRITAASITMSGLADTLARELDRPVEDKTGVAGLFQVSLRWSRQTADPLATPSELPPLDVAVRQKLGLRLQSHKGNVEYLRVTHVERVPVEN